MPLYNLGTARGLIDIDSSGLMGAEVGLRQTGFALTAVGTALVGGVGAVINTAANFEQAMDAVSAVTGETGENMDLLTQKALELGKQGPFGPQQVAEAFVELAKAGLTTQEILDGVGQSTVELAAAGDLALDRSAEILSNTLRTFNLSADAAGHVADVLAGAANASTTDVEDLAVSLKYAGSVAYAVGIPLEDVASALVLLGNSGIKGSTAGTTLRRILLNLQPASKNAANAMKDLGIITEDGANAFFTAEGKAKPLGDILQILKDKTAGLTDAQKLQAINTIFGARASAGALILMKDGVQGLNDAQAAIERTTAGEVAAKRLDNLKGSVERLKAAVQAVFIEAGTPLQGVLKGIVDGLRAFILAFEKIPAPIQSAILVATAFIGILALLGGGLFLTLAPTLQLIRLMGELPEILTTLRTAFSGLTAVIRGFTVSLLTNPVFLITAAILALVAALVYLYFKWEPFHDFVDGLWQTIQDVFYNVIDFFKNLPSTIANAYEGVKSALAGFFDFVKDNWAAILAFMVNPPAATAAWVATHFDEVKDAAGTAVGALKDFVTGGTELAAESSKHFTEVVVDSFNTAKDAVTGNMTITVDEVKKGNRNIEEDNNSLWDNLSSAWGIGWENLSYLAGFSIGEMIGSVGGGFQIIAQLAVTQAQEMLTGVGTWLARLPGTMVFAVTGAVRAILDYGPQWVVQGASFAAQTVVAIFGFLVSLPGKVGGIFLQAVRAIASWIPGAASAALDFSNKILQAFLGLPLQIGKIILDAFGKVASIIKSLAGGAASAASSFARGIWDGIKKGLDIHSPSNVERAFFAMRDNVKASVSDLFDTVGELNSLHRMESALAVASTPLAPAAIIPTASPDASNGGGMIVQGPLVEVASMEVRDDQDITKISRGLAEKVADQQLALGRKVINNA